MLSDMLKKTNKFYIFITGNDTLITHYNHNIIILIFFI